MALVAILVWYGACSKESEHEFLCVEYDNGDQLFVPVHQADRLSRYIGAEGEEPNPTRLGTAEWTGQETGT